LPIVRDGVAIDGKIATNMAIPQPLFER